MPIGDAELIGYHLGDRERADERRGREEKRPTDKLGNFVMVDGKLCVIEYSDFPDDVASRSKDPDGGLAFLGGQHRGARVRRRVP